MVTTRQLEDSKAIQRRTGKTFHVATRFLPARVREATYVLYAFFRIADDVVDDPDPDPPAVQRAELARIREAALGRRGADDPVLDAFSEIRRRHGIPDREVEEFLRAMERDVQPEDDEPEDDEPVEAEDDEPVETEDDQPELTGRDRALQVEFRDADDREAYLRGSAVAVAYMMLAVMDPDDPDAARPHARALGEAFQLTNFLRDVREDAVDYGRIYLPETVMEREGVTRRQIAELRATAAFRSALEAELHVAEERYRTGVAGIRLLPDDCRFPVLLAAVLYAEHHRLIRDRDFDVLSTPPELTATRYLALLVRTWAHWRRTRDPEAVFYRVSAVDPDGAQEVTGDPFLPTRRYPGVRSAGRLFDRARSRLSWLGSD